MPTIDVAALRAAEFPWADNGDRVYLNNASTGPVTRRAVAASAEVTAERFEPFRIDDDKNFAMLARTRALAAAAIGADASEIAILTNTTYGINIAAQTFRWEPGDVVVVHDREFPANIYPWLALEKRGVVVRRIPPDGLLPDEDAFVAAIAGPRVKVASISWVGFSTGYKADLHRIGEACRARGVRLVVDAIQGLGADFLSVRDCHIDVLACGGQKWLMSPWGSGFAYVRQELVRALDPSPVGWMAVRGSDDFTRMIDYDLTWREDARRFEVITLPFQDIAGLEASLTLLQQLGHDAVAARVASLAGEIVHWASARRDITLVTPRDSARRAGIVSLITADSARSSARLHDAGVDHSLREGAIRLSPHVYNTSAEIERALTILDAS
ncbi:MAG: aminotransferase class V-fold PLP-dependent enzyme [Gemmatimonadaceae bacterium]